MDFRLLGPLAVADGEGEVGLPRPKQRALVAALALQPGRVVSTDRLVEALWGDDPPAAALGSLQNAVYQVRKQLGAERLRRQPPGYVLDVDPESVDVVRFERLVEQARASERAAVRARLLREALSLWRGPALADLRGEPFGDLEGGRLDELRLDALEERVAADLALRREGALVPELEALIARTPLRERLTGQLMLALHWSRRTADALEAYDRLRRALGELGLVPSRWLQTLQRQILNDDRAVEAPEPEGEDDASPAPVLVRRTVTVLVASLAGAEGADPEALRRLVGLWFEEARQAVAHHGGSFSSFVGGEVSAVFGAPAAHDDDALRAVRAADELRAAVAELGEGVGIRAGVATGEVLVEEQAGGELTGDVFAVAAALRDEAEAGELLVAESTHGLVRDAVAAGPREERTPRGRTGTLVARRIEGVHGTSGRERRFDVPLVGRTAELETLSALAARSAEAGTCVAVTVLGEPGVGKTRLARELVRSTEAEVLLGRCAPYGKGATWLPVTEIVTRAAGEASEEALAALLDGVEGGELAARRIAELTGAADGAGSRGEAFWALRLLLETLARRRPLLVVLDDVHWAEPALLDLVEYLADRIAEAPVLLLCLAREELLDQRPGWGGAESPVDVLRLEPLGDEDAHALAHELAPLDGIVEGRIVELAEGNPLHVEQLVAYVAEDGGDPALTEVPPTIEAVLASRLDRLDPETRSVLARAAVVGREFPRGAVAALADGDLDADTHLLALARKGLIRPDRAAPPGDDAYRFHHVLLRDVAYRTLTKEARADLHERVATWLDRDGPGDDALVGYHLEQATLYRLEFGASADELASAAGERLARAGLRAWYAADTITAVGLLGRSAPLLPAAGRRAEILFELGVALRTAGRRDESAATLAAAEEDARRVADSRVVARIGIEEALAALAAGHRSPEDVLATAEAAIAVLEPAGDDRGLGRAWLAAGVCFNYRSRNAALADAAERAEIHYRRLGISPSQSLGQQAAALLYGPTPAEMALERCAKLLDRAETRAETAMVLSLMAPLHAMLGDDASAREALESARIALLELGLELALASQWTHPAIQVAYYRGSLSEAIATAEQGLEAALAVGEEMYVATRAAQQAELLAEAGDDVRARALVDVARKRGAAYDVLVQLLVMATDARLLARGGDVGPAEALARRALVLAETTDALVLRADAWLALAEVLDAAGRRADAVEAVDRAAELLMEKQCIRGLDRARRLGAALEPA